jgi:hypothetical protein
MPTEVSDPAEFELDDLEIVRDRIAHCQQYLDEALKAVRQAIQLLPDDDDEDEAA